MNDGAVLLGLALAFTSIATLMLSFRMRASLRSTHQLSAALYLALALAAIVTGTAVVGTPLLEAVARLVCVLAPCALVHGFIKSSRSAFMRVARTSLLGLATVAAVLASATGEPLFVALPLLAMSFAMIASRTWRVRRYPFARAQLTAAIVAFLAAGSALVSGTSTAEEAVLIFSCVGLLGASLAAAQSTEASRDFVEEERLEVEPLAVGK